MNKRELLEAVLSVCRTELCRSNPGWNLAFAWLPYQISDDIIFGTDGNSLFLSEQLLPVYASSPAQIRRGYLHTMLHCLLLHISPPAGVERESWNLACDILVEREIEQLTQPGLQIANPVRTAVMALLPEETISVADMIAELNRLPFSHAELQKAFAFDNHCLWWEGISPDTVQRWKSIQSGNGSLGRGQRGLTSCGIWENFKLLKSDPRDYRLLLRRFMVPGEEIEIDDESFDYIYYDLGIRQYGNLPLLEPLEYREVYRLDELVIAIDTSSSCDEATVSRFLQETFAIMSTQENFFRRMKVVFLQCDCCLQDCVVVHSKEEWQSYARDVKIHGRGGTDFRPVFREIEALRKQGKLKKPRALLYFTDGDGIYPSDSPDYETVFILAGKKIHPELLPDWAVIREVL